MARHKKRKPESLDYHEGLSANQVKIILREFGLESKLDKFNDWMYGQTSPIIKRHNTQGKIVDMEGIYEYDLFRWIDSQKTGIAPVWD